VRDRCSLEHLSFARRLDARCCTEQQLCDLDSALSLLFLLVPRLPSRLSRLSLNDAVVLALYRRRLLCFPHLDRPG